MSLSIIAAVAKNSVIGNKDDLPWRLSDDLRHFASITKGHSVIMGRKTFEAIVNRLGKPLPERKNIILTRNNNFAAPGAIAASSLNEAISKAGGGEIFVIGGAEIYKSAMPLADKLYITYVDCSPVGDSFFPKIDSAIWKKIKEETHQADDKNEYSYSFCEYTKNEQRR